MILDTAMQVFAESGFRGASVREIAARVGMTDTGVLHHFGGKVKLLLEVIKQKEADDLSRGSDPFGRRLVARNAERGGSVRLFTTLSAEATDPDHPAHVHFVERYARIRKEITDRFTVMSAAGDIPADIDPAMASRLMVAVMDGLQIQWLLDPSMDMNEAYTDFVTHYFGADAARASAID